MNKVVLILYLSLMYNIIDVDGLLLKHLPTRPGGIIDSLLNPKPGGFQMGSHLGGGISFGLGPFGFNFGFNKEYRPGGVNQPPKEQHVPGGESGHPDGNPYIPGVNTGYPDGNPYIPVGNPFIPAGNPFIPNGNPYNPTSKPVIPQNPEIKPGKPSTKWEDEENHKEPYDPPSKEKDYSKPEFVDDDKKDYPKPGSYEDTSSPKREDKDRRPNWEDIGETYNKDSKSENYMDSDLVGDGLIQPRLNPKKRIKRFIESKVYHVPILFQSNAKPTQVKIQNSLNSLEKVSLVK